MKGFSIRRPLLAGAVMAALIAFSPAVSLGVWQSGIGFDITPTSLTTLDASESACLRDLEHAVRRDPKLIRCLLGRECLGMFRHRDRLSIVSAPIWPLYYIVIGRIHKGNREKYPGIGILLLTCPVHTRWGATSSAGSRNRSPQPRTRQGRRATAQGAPGLQSIRDDR